MKIKFLFLTLFCCASITLSSQAQKNNDIAKSGDLMCNCINEVLNDLHPQIKVFIEDVDKSGMQKAQENLITYITNHPEQAEDIQKSANKMTNLDSYILEVEGCKDLENELNKFEKNIDNFETKLLDYLKTSDHCKMTYLFYKIGISNK